MHYPNLIIINQNFLYNEPKYLLTFEDVHSIG